MKQLLITFMALTVFFSTSAQIENGTVLFGGSSNLNFSNATPSGGGSSTSITQVNLKAGYFLAQNFVLGLNVNYQSVDTYSVTQVGAFARFYPGGKFFLGLGYNSLSSSGGSSSTGQTVLEAGYAAFVTRNIAVEPALNYTSVSGGSILGLSVGFSLYLNRGTE